MDKLLLLSNEKSYSIENGKKPINDSIPTMTSNTTPSGVVSASSIFSTTYPAWKAFDKKDDSQGWASLNGTTFPQFLKYDFGKQIIIRKYSIKSRNSNENDISQTVKDWELQGSNDDINWITLDKKVNEVGWKATEKREYIIKNNKEYRYYRIYITANNGSTVTTSIGEMEMFEGYPDKINQIPSHSEQNLIKYGMESPVQVDGMFTDKNYVLSKVDSSNEEGLLVTMVNRKPLSIKFN